MVVLVLHTLQDSCSTRRPSLTDVHHVVVHAVNSDHFHEVVVVVSPLQTVAQVRVVPEQVAEELQVRANYQRGSWILKWRNTGGESTQVTGLIDRWMVATFNYMKIISHHVVPDVF